MVRFVSFALFFSCFGLFAAATDPSGLTLVDLTVTNGMITSSNAFSGAADIGPEEAFNDEWGRPVVNETDGRIVSVSTNGLYIGNVNYASTFINKGLLESRTDSLVEIAENATHVIGNTPAATNELGGTVAGGGSFVFHRPVELAAGAKLQPGDLALNEALEADGRGASTVGDIHFSTNLTVALDATVELQLVSGESYDTVSCDGDLVLAGTVALDDASKPGLYRDVFKAHGSIDATGVIRRGARWVGRPRLVSGTYEYDEVESYDEEESVELDDGNGGKTNGVQTVTKTRTVTKTGSSLSLLVEPSGTRLVIR